MQECGRAAPLPHQNRLHGSRQGPVSTQTAHSAVNPLPMGVLLHTPLTKGQHGVMAFQRKMVDVLRVGILRTLLECKCDVTFLPPSLRLGLYLLWVNAHPPLFSFCQSEWGFVIAKVSLTSAHDDYFA